MSFAVSCTTRTLFAIFLYNFLSKVYLNFSITMLYLGYNKYAFQYKY